MRLADDALVCRNPMGGANLLNVVLAMAASLSATSQVTIDPSNIKITAIYYIVEVGTTVKLGRRRLLVCFTAVA